MTWIIENEAFASGDILFPVLKELNKDVIFWDDKFWNTEEYKSFCKKNLDEIEHIRAEYVNVDLSDEEKIFKRQQ